MSTSMNCCVKQVVGLTASPGAGNADTVVKAVEHVLELCANMDAMEISTVRDEVNLAEMMKHIQQANEGVVGRWSSLCACNSSFLLTDA